MTNGHAYALCGIFSGACWGGITRLIVGPGSSVPAYVFLGTTVASFILLSFLLGGRDNDHDDGPNL